MKNSMRGFKDVFLFSYIQTMKTKGMKIFNIVICLALLISLPIYTYFNSSDKKENEKTNIKNVLVVDNTPFDIVSKLNIYETDTKIYKDISYKETKIDYSKFEESELKDIYTFNDDNSVYLEINYMENAVLVNVMFSKSSKVKEKDAEKFADFIYDNLNNIYFSDARLSEKEFSIIKNEVEVNYRSLEETDVKPAKKGRDENASQIVISFEMIVMFILAFAGGRISLAIITEKSSKIMEYLMVSIKPMAVVIGKVISNLFVIVTQFLIIVISYVASYFVSGLIYGKENVKVPEFMKSITDVDSLKGANLLTIILSILIIGIGFYIYGLVAGLSGASVSKLEEAAEGQKMFTLLLILCTYFAMYYVMFANIANTNLLKYIAMYVPFISTIISPGLLLTGYMKISDAFIALAIMFVVAGALTNFVSNVYESLIYYNGNPMKIKDIINISKEKKSKVRGKKNE